jgi:hypothetical protein
VSNDVQSYLDYLDKEMTIMGVLSAFSISVATVAIGAVIHVAPKPFSAISTLGLPYVIAGSVFSGLAACAFYFQRSLLAWYYGQIALSRFRGTTSAQSIADNVTWADGWDTWFWYGAAFVALALSCLTYVSAILVTFGPKWTPFLAKWTIFLLTGAAILHGSIRWAVLRTYPQAEKPFGEMWTAIRKKLSW